MEPNADKPKAPVLKNPNANEDQILWKRLRKNWDSLLMALLKLKRQNG